MSYPADPPANRSNLPYRDDGRVAPPTRAEDPQAWDGPPPVWDPEPTARPAPRPRKSKGIVRALLLVVLVVAVAGGGLYAADRLGYLDLAGLTGGSTGGGSGVRPTAATRHVVFSGRAAELVAAEGNIIQEDTSTSPPTVWLRSRNKTANPTGATDGVTVTVPNAIVPLLEGRAVRVTVTAMTGGKDDPRPFAVAYSAGTNGTSGWFVFLPTRRMEDYSFTYNVPIGEMEGSDNVHRIAIWSDIGGSNGPLAVKEIFVSGE